MKIRRITPANPTSGKRCPDCGSHDTIPWADGWMCRDCGCEWGKDNGYPHPLGVTAIHDVSPAPPF